MNSSGFMGSLGIISQAFAKCGEFWKRQSTSKKRLIVVLGVAGLLMVAAFCWLINQTQYTVLYAGLSAADAGEILQQLEEMKMSAKPEGSDTILVPKDKVDWIRMELAAAGYPKTSTNLEILQQGAGFGVTEEDKAIYRRYQLQDDLQKAIKTFACIADARVSLNIPENSTFLIEDRQSSATAAVLLTLRPGSTLSAGNIQAISQLVQKSVPDLKPENVSIVDSNMNVLNTDSGANEFLAADQQTMEQQVADRLKKQIMALLQPVFGVNKVLAEVNVTLNFDESVVDTVRFEPSEGSSTGMMASIDKIREVAQNASGDSGGEAGTATNGSAATIYPVVGVDDTVYEKNSEKINYEINTIKEHLVKAKGAISNLSVSVILDSQATEKADYSDNVKNLVAAAVGVSPDFITVEKLPFQGIADQNSTWEDYQEINVQALKWQRIRFFILLGAGGLFALLIFILLKRIIKGSRPSKEEEIMELFPSFRSERPDLGPTLVKPVESDEKTVPEMMIEQDAGQKEKRTIESYIETNPELAASILRSWLAEEQG